ncbi:MAG: hypothetical protein NVSMB44_19380 [Ktedonobacteraceae bacterium]
MLVKPRVEEGASLRETDRRNICHEATGGAVSAVRFPDPWGKQRASAALWSTTVSSSSGKAGVRSDELGRLSQEG